MLPLTSRTRSSPITHGKEKRDIEGSFGERVSAHVGIATGDVVIRLHHDEEHCEQDGGTIDDARRHVVGIAAQQIAREPERGRRYAIAVQQPIEDWPSANRIADDARVPSDAPENAEGDRSSEPAECGQGPLLGHPGDTGNHQCKCNR